jgi:hypothetical protein
MPTTAQARPHNGMDEFEFEFGILGSGPCKLARWFGAARGGRASHDRGTGARCAAARTAIPHAPHVPGRANLG